MNRIFADIASLALIGFVIVLTIYLYPGLPEQMPIHWDAGGHANGFAAKRWAVLVLPLAAVVALALMKLIPAISPKGYGTEEFSGVLSVVQLAIVAFTCGTAVLILLEAAGHDTHIVQMILGGVGVLFIIIGVQLRKVRKNFFFGIRTPWTLASDEVWARTHSFGGRLFTLSGLIMIGAALLPMYRGWCVATAIVIVLIPIPYSYVIYRRVEGFGGDSRRR